MRYLLLAGLMACASPKPEIESDLPFCKEDRECTTYRSRCGKFVAFNEKYQTYVEAQFKQREENIHCGNYPDQRQYSARCEMNTCVLVERDSEAASGLSSGNP